MTDTWGLSTFISLGAIFIIFCLYYTLKDKKELELSNDKKIKNSEYSEFRGKLKNKLFNI